MLGRLIPRDEGFFDLFNQMAGHLVSAARLLNDLLAAPGRRTELVRAIKDVEHRADELMVRFGQRIDKSFITPIDREDIHLLASRLDDVVDLVDGTARRFEMLHITEVRDPALRMGRVLVQATEQIERAVEGIKLPPAVAAAGAEVKRLEEEGDALYHEAVGQLFASVTDPIEVLKWKEMYDTLERTLDACQFVSTVLQSISLKNT